MRVELRRLLILAAPIVAAMISRMALTFTDFVMVSRLGTDAIAAINPATIATFVCIATGMGITTSIQTYAAQSLGRGRAQQAGAYAWQGFYLAGIFLLASGPLTLLVAPFWSLIGNAPDVQAMETAYCRIALWCLGPAIVCASLEMFFTGIQKPTIVLMSTLIAIVFNFVANYVLIFGHFGFPAMGIQGAAIATLIAWSVRALVMASVFFSREFRDEFGTSRGWRFDWTRFRGVVNIGGPTALQWLTDIGSWFMFMSVIMAGYGTAVLAAAGTCFQYMHFSFMPAVGVGVAVSSLIGHAIGAGRPDLAMRRANLGLLVTGTYMSCVGLSFFLLRYPLMDVLTDDPAVIAAGASMLIWVALFQVFDAFGITYINALRGTGDTRWPALVVAFHCWGIFILGGYIVATLRPDWGLHGPWMMATTYIILLGLVLRWRFTRGGWQKINLFKGEDAAPQIEEAAAPAISTAAIPAPRAEPALQKS